MKTLINKTNPRIRISAPEIKVNIDTQTFYIGNEMFDMEDWTLVVEEQKPILEVFGFKVGDAVRLKDGDGRKHIIKSFEEVEGIHGPNFYQVEFEDNSARDGIYPGKEYPNGYYTQMEKIEEEPVDLEEEIEKKWNECDSIDEGMGAEYANIVIDQFDEICKYFYELGLKAKEE